jgi:DNA-binding phage protein
VPLGKSPEPSPLARAFSAHVRMVMAREGVTTQALAEKLEVSRTYLGKRLRDEMAFTLTDVEAISNALGLELPKLPEL